MNTIFPTSNMMGNNGFLFIDFSAIVGNDFSETLIDELQLETSNGFVYLGVDNFEFCQDTPPDALISTMEPNPTGTNPIPVTITFTEEVTGLTTNEILVSNGMPMNLQTTDNIVFTVDIIPMATGLVTVDVPAGVAQDMGGNDNNAAVQFTIMYDFSLSTENLNTVTFSFINPVKNSLDIISGSEIEMIEVYGLNGVKIKSSRGNRVDVANLSAVVYFALIKTINGQMDTIKFIKN